MPPTEPVLNPGAQPEVLGKNQTIPEADPVSLRGDVDEGSDIEMVINREEFENLQRDLEQALAKADEHWKRYLGAHAEMENVRRRTEREVQNAHKFALERFFGELLPVRDSLALGLAAANHVVDVAQLREGVELTLKQLAAAMEKFGAREIDPIGLKFNPAEHEAMAAFPTDQAEPNTIMQVVQKGYLLNDRLIRPAKVIVAQAAPKSSG